MPSLLSMPVREAGGAVLGFLRVVREAGGGHWVTIEQEGEVTHIFISSGGTVTKGPKHLIGAKAGHLPPAPGRTVTHHPEGHTPKGATDHPSYTERQEPEKGQDTHSAVVDRLVNRHASKQPGEVRQIARNLADTADGKFGNLPAGTTADDLHTAARKLWKLGGGHNHPNETKPSSLNRGKPYARTESARDTGLSKEQTEAGLQKAIAEKRLAGGPEEQIKQAFEDWHSGRLHLDRAGKNYRLRPDAPTATDHGPSGAVAPYNKLLKARFKDVGEFHGAATAAKKPTPQEAPAPKPEQPSAEQQAPTPQSLDTAYHAGLHKAHEEIGAATEGGKPANLHAHLKAIGAMLSHAGISQGEKRAWDYQYSGSPFLHADTPATFRDAMAETVSHRATDVGKKRTGAGLTSVAMGDYNEPVNKSPEEMEGDADAMARQTMRERHPEIRRGSKEYDARHTLYLSDAMRIAHEQKAKAHEAKIADLERHHDMVGKKEATSAEAEATDLERQASEVDAVHPNHPAVAQAHEAARARGEDAAGLRGRYDQHIAAHRAEIASHEARAAQHAQETQTLLAAYKAAKQQEAEQSTPKRGKGGKVAVKEAAPRLFLPQLQAHAVRVRECAGGAVL